jgi:hypothetical protein
VAAVGAQPGAQTAKRSPEFAATYTAIAKRRGKKIATIAIARKLLTAHTTHRHAGHRHEHAAAAAVKTEGHQAPGTLAPAA